MAASCSCWLYIMDSSTDSWLPDSSNLVCSSSRLLSRSPAGTSSTDSLPPMPGTLPKLNSPSDSLPSRVRRWPRAFRRLAWACSSPTRAATALISRCASSRAAASSDCCLLRSCLSLAICDSAAPLAPRRAKPVPKAMANKPMQEPPIIAATLGLPSENFFGARKNLDTMITFIMVKRTHSQDRVAAGPGSPPQALQAAASAGLGPPIQRAQMPARLDQSLRQNLPAAVAQQCRLANVDQDRLVFLVNAPVWKNKLRLMADVLLDAAAAAGFPARTLVVKVVPSFDISPEMTIGKPLSEAVRESLRATAQSVKDPDLRAQLMKLASLP